ncbi:unnamed protein product [Owenia fusiformis]|uniref:ParB/Sulfiredoxin domain-containing protein n=1 Tax=Owenia fusiformis TaxID=6347 RepID=A0A8S4P0U6_OWEFU|nr:unnamed protein product [Owenia fusiformis]
MEKASQIKGQLEPNMSEKDKETNLEEKAMKIKLGKIASHYIGIHTISLGHLKASDMVRSLDDANVRAIAKSFEMSVTQCGDVPALTVNVGIRNADEYDTSLQHTIIDGNHRFAAAKVAGTPSMFQCRVYYNLSPALSIPLGIQQNDNNIRAKPMCDLELIAIIRKRLERQGDIQQKEVAAPVPETYTDIYSDLLVTTVSIHFC